MNIKYNSEIHHKALDKVSEVNKLEEYILDCIAADLCPKCGKDLEYIGKTYKCKCGYLV